MGRGGGCKNKVEGVAGAGEPKKGLMRCLLSTGPDLLSALGKVKTGRPDSGAALPTTTRAPHPQSL